MEPVEQVEQELRLLRPEQLQLSAVEQNEIRTCLSNPAVQKYITILEMNSMVDVLANTAETQEEQQRLIARLQKFKGVQIMCGFLRSVFATQSVAPVAQKGSNTQ